MAVVVGALALGAGAGGLLLAQERVYGGHRCVAVGGSTCAAPPGEVTGCLAPGAAAGAAEEPPAPGRRRC